MPWPTERNLLFLIAGAYIVGSIPFGLLVGWTRGIDVRNAGSGNIGASNVGRLLGKRFFFGVMFLDLLKSLLPMLAASIVIGNAVDRPANPSPLLYSLWLMVGFAAILGHMFSLFLKFKGGKGVATSMGVLLGLWPYYTVPGFITIAIFVVLFFATRYVSVGSIGAAASFPIAYLLMGLVKHWQPFGGQWPLLAFAVVIAGLVIFKHRGNISRLRAGTEYRMTRSAEPAMSAESA